MKVSKFNSIVTINSKYFTLFNTLTEKYFLFKSEDYNDLLSVLASSSFSHTFSETKNTFYDKCVSENFLIDDNEDELLAYTKKFENINDDKKFHLTLFNNKHNSNSFNFWFDLSNRISNLIEKVSIKHSEMQISWFITGEYTHFKFLTILTNKFKAICTKNNCAYSSSILIHDKFPEYLDILLQRLIVNTIEINVSSCSQDKTCNIAENIALIFKIRKDVKVNLIIDLNDDNVFNVKNMLQSINYQYRKKIDLIFYNHLKFAPELFLYRIYMTTIYLGYKFTYLDTVSSLVSSLRKNSYCIDSDSNIASCVASAKANDYFAKLDDDGSINIFNKPLYFKYLHASILDNYKCMCCPELPICLANYPYYRSVSRFLCIKSLYNDLTLEHKIKLKILSDTIISKEMPQIIQ